MGLSTAEKNRRKRERKKREKAEEKKRLEEEAAAAKQQEKPEDEVEIEYVAEALPELEQVVKTDVNKVEGLPDGLPPALGHEEEANDAVEDQDMNAVLRRFQERAAVAAVVSDDEHLKRGDAEGEDDEEELFFLDAMVGCFLSAGSSNSIRSS